jgi:dihydrofolate reductase
MNKSINFNAIVAMNNIDQGIGFKENLPWNIKEDNDYFMRVVETT